jgi:adenylate kinase family enzyme
MCSAICAAHGLPYFEIDKIQWKPNWVSTPETEYQDAHEEILSSERWLIDGYGSTDSIERRLDACDTVVFVDHPIHIHFWWATKRQIKSLLFGRPDGPDGCPMWRVTFRLYKMMWWLHKEMRPKLTETIYERADDIRIIHIKSPDELNAFRNRASKVCSEPRPTVATVLQSSIVRLMFL